ncbi:nuclear transport factor 2 family protein [Nonomuraea indica]|uniref:Nuclear transport factor 2 family protein n=1 Tax=Nonomuraea indica TaxID=1581193 RepID=A0ABW8A2Q1_9ACTN
MAISTRDHLDIVATCTRMAWHADRREWDELADVFADEVLVDYTSLNGGEPAVLAPADIVTAWTAALGGFDATQHLLTNHLVSGGDDEAVCTAAFQASHHLSDPLGSSAWVLGGTYRFDLVRTGAGWRIRGVVMTATWATGNKDLLAKAAAR